MNSSFPEMFDSAGVILRANRMPVEDSTAIRELLMSEPDSSYIFT